MRRPDHLTVDCDPNTPSNAQVYQITQSPSVHSTRKSSDSFTSDAKSHRDTAPAPAPVPSIRLLFSLLSRRDFLLLVLPAILSSLVAGGVAPFMTLLVGAVFDAFAKFPQSGSPSQQDRDALLKAVGFAAIELAALAVGAIALGSITSALWISTGERNLMRLRSVVYRAVSRRDMEWFDTKMGADDSDAAAFENDGPVGAGGLMAKFNRDTDDVRMASSLASGMLLQYLTTCTTCLILAFLRSWALTLVILSAVPLLTLIQIISQRFAGPLVQEEREHTGRAATLIERAVSAISTVKAFNAQPAEQAALNPSLDAINAVTLRVNALWGATSACSQFVSMAMFVQGFWFGAFLVRRGSVGAGDVLAVFWACLIAAGCLQLCIPQFITLARGKFAMVALVMLVGPQEEDEHDADAEVGIGAERESSIRKSTATDNSMFSDSKSYLTSIPISPRRQQRLSRLSRLSHPRRRKIQPSFCTGEFSVHNITFSYPSRPSLPVLRSVSMYFPANETTFVVGGSGSGKSTVAQLLVRLYDPDPGEGVITLDGCDVGMLDERWVRGRVALVSQCCVLFPGRTIFENVALGAGLSLSPSSSSPSSGGEVERREVERVCTAALMHEFVRDLPEGYDTILGGGGSAGDGMSLSGGQKQRLAIARAMLRDPDVLVLDEATSALDATSRVLVFEAIKAWRRNKTTIVITHDLSQITAGDFVYVLKEGCVVEQGYRADLEAPPPSFESDPGGVDSDAREEGAFRAMMRAQGESGGFRPRRESQIEVVDLGGGGAAGDNVDVEKILEAAEREKEEEEKDERRLTGMLGLASTTSGASTVARRMSVVGGAGGAGAGLSKWMVDVVGDLTRSRSVRARDENQQQKKEERAAQLRRQMSLAQLGVRHPPLKPKPKLMKHRSLGGAAGLDVGSKRLSVQRHGEVVEEQRGSLRRHLSLQFTPATPTPRATFGVLETRREEAEEEEDDDEEEEEDEFEHELEKTALERMAEEATRHRQRRAAGKRMCWTEVKLDNIVIDTPSSKRPSPHQDSYGYEEEKPTSFIQLMRDVHATVPNKRIIALGIVICIASGAMTPIFSFLLSRLLFQVSTGAQDVRVINTFGGIVLAVACLDGVLAGLKFFVMESSAMVWITRLRKACYSRLLSQPKAFFDRNENGPAEIVQVLMKDGDDARNLVAVVLAQGCAVCAMVGLGLVWAMVSGWQLTLAGFAIAPVFAGTMALQAGLVAKAERRNKVAREEIAKSYYECISNIRAIRCMSFEPVFTAQFEELVARAHRIGIRGAFIEGCSYGVANGLIYFAEALLFFVGAVLVANGTYTYLQMVEVLNLVVFSVTIGAQLMSFTQKITRATQATRELNKVLALSTDTDESRGKALPPIDGDIRFTNVDFSYPERADVPILHNISLTLRKNECVAIVGASGSGKSTLAALLQRLYEPTSGAITIGGHDVRAMDVKHLRAHIAVVSQHPCLFDASVAENIAYGNDGLAPADVVYAAQAAHVHGFVMGLPRGYETPLGEHAALISGGQAQRLAIARALARPARVLVLDECTSALDPESQRCVMETIGAAKRGRTTVVVTHKLAVMRMCERIVVLDGGRVVEEGAFEELVGGGGVFARLARGGEWVGDGE